MEYVEGSPLHKMLHGRPLSPDKVAMMGEQVARAMSRAHRRSLLHRDLKPGNMLVTSEGDVKVVDFGLAAVFQPLHSALDLDLPTMPVGRELKLAGTLPYMSPEQARGEHLDARSDIFSLGVVLYEMTTGDRPFAGVTPADLLQEILRARPMPIHERVGSVPLDLERIIRKAMAPNRKDRYQTMEDLAVDLRHLSRELETGSSPSYDSLQGALESTRATHRRKLRL